MQSTEHDPNPNPGALQMSVVELVCLADSGSSLRKLKVEGTTFNPDEGRVVGVSSLDPALTSVAEICAVCNEATIENNSGAYRAVGAPTEAALIVLTEKLGCPDANESARLIGLRQSQPETQAAAISRWYGAKLNRMALLEFDRNRKSSSIICTPVAGGGSGRTRSAAPPSSNVLLVKGAAECVVERCDRMMLPDGKVQAHSCCGAGLLWSTSL